MLSPQNQLAPNFLNSYSTLMKAFVFLLIFFLSACATKPPMDLQQVDVSLGLNKVIANIDEFRNKKVLWGGVIVHSQNLAKSTQLEVLAYPLTRNYKPDVTKTPLGRFLAQYAGYLETLDYAPGRQVTLTGVIHDIQSGKIGEAEYRYVDIAAQQIYLWPKQDAESDSQVHFGFGIMLSN